MCGATGAGRGAGDHVQYFPVSADSRVHLLAASLSFVPIMCCVCEHMCHDLDFKVVGCVIFMYVPTC